MKLRAHDRFFLFYSQKLTSNAMNIDLDLDEELSNAMGTETLLVDDLSQIPSNFLRMRASL